MRSTLLLMLDMLLAGTLAISATGQTGKPVTPAAKALHDLFDIEWDYSMREAPERASELGDRRWNDRWDDRSLQAIERRNQHNLEVLTRLAKIDRSTLSAIDRLNYDLFKQQVERRIESHKFKKYLIPLDQRSGIQTIDELADALRFETVKDYEDWIARLKTFPTLMDQTIELMRLGARERYVHPKIIMQRLPAQIDKQLVGDATQSGFYRPFRHFAREISPADQQRLSQQAQQAIHDQIVPAFQKFKFFVSEYLPACFDQVGAWQLPQGDESYAFDIRNHTTLNLSADQIHQIGLREVERIRNEMQRVMAQTGFQGTREEFFKFLRTDPQFFYKTPQELFDAYKAVAKTVDPNLVKLFRTLPREPYGVEEIPATVAPDTTTAYYRAGAADGSRAGTYFVNVYKPETRPKWEMMALTLHESVPGHHLQIARSHEIGELPKFRRYGDGLTAFVEGWGLYGESLGDDMGLYSDPYSKFGQLTYEMWRAVRLVVDTGMHAKHWTRDQAIRYFMDNAPKQELDVTNEIDRYIAWPGQALAYKMGELKIKELRTHARQELGANFDIREFHDVVLGSGPLPLDILEHNVNEWVAKRKSSATRGSGSS